MKIYALVGKSGTGKSYQAINLCREKQIESIIDDGLFIFHNNDVVGNSAKREPTKVGAIKTALFTDDEHQKVVMEAIKEAAPASILIIGTSEKMVGRIRDRLELPEISEMIHIEDITTETQRAYARKQRENQGKHIVPVPSAKLKKTFSGYFMTPIRRFRIFGGRREDEEKTVVRPTFSYLGEFLIAPQVITDIVTLTGEALPGVAIPSGETGDPEPLGVYKTIKVQKGRIEGFAPCDDAEFEFYLYPKSERKHLRRVF